MTDKEHKKMLNDLDQIFNKHSITENEKKEITLCVMLILVYQIQNKDGSVLNFLKKKPNKKYANESIFDYKEIMIQKNEKDGCFSLIKQIFKKHSIPPGEHNRIFEIIGTYCFHLILCTPGDFFKFLQEWNITKGKIK